VNQTVEGGKTLLVDGPASVRVVSGKAEVLGFSVKHAGRIVVREGKRMPFFVVETAVFDVSLGENASVEEVEGNTVPTSWIDSVEVLMGLQKPPVAMVMGKADSGKTSFCTYLVNKLVSANCKVAILDGDLGQSDIGPPCTAAYAVITKPLTELYGLKARNAFFVGATSPSAAVSKTIEGMALMKAEILDAAADVVVVNTDGWVEGEEAAKYKLQLTEMLQPDIVVCIQQKNELEPLLAALGKYRTIEVKASLAVKHRSMEKRKNLRERSYAKHLRDAKVKAFPLNQLTIEEKTALSIWHGEERGLLLGFYDAHRKFLGIGVLHEVDSLRKTLKVLTSVSAKPSRVVFGKVRLDENLKEATAFSGENNRH
jgi:polynucleotide 5'-hydroxyl-kinase GRC3/NOL9